VHERGARGEEAKMVGEDKVARVRAEAAVRELEHALEDVDRLMDDHDPEATDSNRPITPLLKVLMRAAATAEYRLADAGYDAYASDIRAAMQRIACVDIPDARRYVVRVARNMIEGRS
jgi:rubrerythrin